MENIVVVNNNIWIRTLNNAKLVILLAQMDVKVKKTVVNQDNFWIISKNVFNVMNLALKNTVAKVQKRNTVIVT